MQKEELYRWIENPDRMDAPTAEELRTVVEEYPYFHTARLLYTKALNLTDSRKYEEELGKTALLCNDRRQLFYLIYREEYGKMLNKSEDIRLNRSDRTEELLESFLSSLDEKEMIEPALENMELNLATTDYFSYLKSLGESAGGTGQEVGVTGRNGEESANQDQGEYRKLQHHDIIDAFIEKAESETLFAPLSREETPLPTTKQETAEKEEEGEFLTETLAKIYIKQKKYEQALTIIKRLSLNFPKKSVYFAHQIRFLELLIANERFR